SVGLDPDTLVRSLHDVFLRRAAITEVVHTLGPRLDIVPATIDLAGSEVLLLTRTGREHVLARALEALSANYAVVLVDCPPSLGVLTINGLTAAESVLVPLQCEALSHRGVGQLLDTIEAVRAFADGARRGARRRPGRGAGGGGGRGAGTRGAGPARGGPCHAVTPSANRPCSGPATSARVAPSPGPSSWTGRGRGGGPCSRLLRPAARG